MQTASAVMAAVGDIRRFASLRQLVGYSVLTAGGAHQPLTSSEESACSALARSTKAGSSETKVELAQTGLDGLVLVRQGEP